MDVSRGQLAVWALLGTASMLFAGFASAYLVRRQGLDWLQVRLPGILRLDTIVLLASSAAVEGAQGAHRRGRLQDAGIWLSAATALGLAFLGGQLVAWRQLAAQGMYLPTNPYSSFFYMLTAAHGVHLVGGIAALGYLFWRVTRAGGEPLDAHTFKAGAAYWHFVDVVWVLLYALLLFD